MTHTPQEPTVQGEWWIEVFDRGFVFEGGNSGDDAPIRYMYRVNEDGSRTLATREYVIAFIRQTLVQQHEKDMARVREMAHLLQVILPMAKGYAHENPVGNNRSKVQQAEDALDDLSANLKEI